VKILVACEESQAVIWVPIKNFEGYYEVSNFGEIRSLPRNIIYSDGREHEYTGKILKPGISSGYLFVNLHVGGKSYSRKIHNLVAEHFLNKKYNNDEVRHLNGNKHDNRCSNLAYGSRSKNVLDGYSIYGYTNKLQKLSPMIAAKIRIKYSRGYSQRKLAVIYNVSKSTISAIVNYRIYNEY
jgi:hypothetical protein